MKRKIRYDNMIELWQTYWKNG